MNIVIEDSILAHVFSSSSQNNEIRKYTVRERDTTSPSQHILKGRDRSSPATVTSNENDICHQAGGSLQTNNNYMYKYCILLPHLLKIPWSQLNLNLRERDESKCKFEFRLALCR